MKYSNTKISGSYKIMIRLVLMVWVVSLLTGCTLAINNQPNSLAPMLKKAMPAVVNIQSESLPVPCPDSLAGGSNRSNGDHNDKNREMCVAQLIGSGVIVDADKGYIITSFHTVELADSIVVTLQDERVFNAKMIGKDPRTDIAIIQIEANKLTSLAWADSRQLQVGDFVVAIGSPFGLGQTVTFGMVSALKRRGLGLTDDENFIQMDAPINVGNSGGALLNMQGKLVGINESIISTFGSNTGVGFAIPANTAKAISHQLIQYGGVQRGQLGVYLKARNKGDQKGAYVLKMIKNSPAVKAGMKAGDCIISFNGEAITDQLDLKYVLGLLRAGSTVEIVVLREGRELSFMLVLAEPIRND